METDQGTIHVHLHMSERQVSPYIQGSLPCTKTYSRVPPSLLLLGSKVSLV